MWCLTRIYYEYGSEDFPLPSAPIFAIESNNSDIAVGLNQYDVSNDKIELNSHQLDRSPSAAL